MTQNHILVTGGAGYIGSHACKALQYAGYVPVTFDNLVTGWQDAVKFGPFEQGDLLNRSDIDRVFEKYDPVAVMHFAALSQVGESMQKPGLYWQNNVMGSLNLIQAAVDHGCMDFVFSSTCATYGDQDNVVLDVDVCDLVDAHVLGLKCMQSWRGSRVFNLGTGDRFSVRQLIDQTKHVTNRPVPVAQVARRPGDCAKLVS